jgi:PAS domain S-box-containing protein
MTLTLVALNMSPEKSVSDDRTNPNDRLPRVPHTRRQRFNSSPFSGEDIRSLRCIEHTQPGRNAKMENEIKNNTNQAARSPLQVLLIEDNPDDVELCLRLLKKAYPDVRCDVVRAQEEFAAHIASNSYDVILADYYLGEWTGLDAFMLMQFAGQDVPFILMTGVLGDERAIECIKSGVTDYVLKDRPDRLAIAIARALKERELFEERQRAQYALMQNEAKFRMLAEAIPAAAFIEQGTRCCYVNRAAEAITGYSREELLEMNFWSLILPDSRKAVMRQSAAQFNEDQTASRFMIQILTKQGQVRWVDATVGVFQNEGRLAALITAFDVTERNQAECELFGLTNLDLPASRRAGRPMSLNFRCPVLEAFQGRGF